MKQLIGTGVALITPFNEDLSIDIEALTKIVNFNIENGIDYLVVLGTTAESATLNKEEKKQVRETIVKINAGRLPLVLGIGGNNTQSVLQEIEETDLTDFTALLSVSPYYNKPTQEGIYQHFSTIAQNSPLPIILYNVPGRTASNILPQTVVKLAKNHNNIIGIKEAKGDLVQAMQLIQDCPDDFLIISGDDMIALPMVLAGGSGVISVIGEGFPKEFSKMIQLGLQGKVKEAYQLHYKIAPAINYIFEEGNPAGIKAVFAKLGLCKNVLRLPLLQVSDNLSSKINQFITSF
ncbi:MAG: 4-hydroxy-tetrahydrodipicolinate synthase [Flavobacteriales bacterium]